jgi:hypothetical protein
VSSLNDADNVDKVFSYRVPHDEARLVGVNQEMDKFVKAKSETLGVDLDATGILCKRIYNF